MKKTERDIDDLIKEIKVKTKLTQEEIAGRIGYNRSYLSQAKKTDSEKLYSALQKEFKPELENITIDREAPKEKATLEKLADSTSQLSESNLINAKNIERLISILENKLFGVQGMQLPAPGTKGTRTLTKKEERK